MQQAVDLAALLENTQPASLLVISQSAVPATEAYISEHPDYRLTLRSGLLVDAADPDDAETPLHDLAIIADTLEHLDHAGGLELIGTIRNRYASRIYLAISEDAHAEPKWTDTDFFSLGMQRAGEYSNNDRTTRIYTYDLETYNRKRAWNSPKNWANPENFGKYWW